MKTDPSTTIRFLAEARDCAIQMMENGAYIQKELPSLRMPDGLRHHLEALCANLIGTKHDLIHEIFEIGEIMDSTPDAPDIAERIEQMRQSFLMVTMSLHGRVQDVQRAVEQGEADGLLPMLVMESAVNILNAVPANPDTEEQSETQPVDDEDEYEEDDDEDGYDPNCFAFYSEDSYPIGQLIATIRSLSERPNLSPETAENLKVFLFAMERMPLITPGVRMSLALRLDQGGESDWIEIRMEDGEFTLGRGAWIDGDADTVTVSEVTPTYREGDAFAANHFAESFAECARDVCREIVIEDFSDKPFTGWDLEQDKSRWRQLPNGFI